MDMQFHGANCSTIHTKYGRIVIDDTLADVGLKTVTKSGDLVLYTDAQNVTMPVGSATPRLIIDHPGEYEVAGASIYGIGLRGHRDEADTKRATAYKIIIDDVRYFVAGHLHPDLSERDLETIGTVDVMVVPTGGNGYTLDPIGALKLIKKLEPKLVIPTHYADSAVSYPVPQQTLEQVLQGLSMEPLETTDKLRVKIADLPEGTHLVVLKRV